MSVAYGNRPEVIVRWIVATLASVTPTSIAARGYPAHRFGNPDRCATAGKRVDHDVAGLGEKPQHVLDGRWRHAAEEAALPTGRKLP
jgi:hypothetical protein